MKLGEWLVSLFSLLISLVFIIESFRLPALATDPGGLTLAPRIFGGMTAVAAVFMIVSLIRRSVGTSTPTPVSDAALDQTGGGAEPDGKPFPLRQLVFVAALTILYPLAITKLGFLISTFLYVWTMLLGLKANWIKAGTLSVAVSVLLYFVFGTVLDVFLPGGDWLALVLE